MKIVIVTGITGIDKSAFIKKFIKRARISKRSKVIKFEAELVNQKRMHGSVRPPGGMTAFLNGKSLTQKTRYVEETFGWIAKHCMLGPDIDYVFLDVHLSYYKNSEYFPPLNPSNFANLISSISPDAEVLIINLIDDVFNTWHAIASREKEYPKTRLTLREILGWRSLESLMSDLLSQALPPLLPHEKPIRSYVISIRHPYTTFKNLILCDTPTCVYLSYPISNTRECPNRVAAINEFRAKMHKLGDQFNISVFDPVAIDELRGDVKRALKNHGDLTLHSSRRWPLDHQSNLVPSPPDQIRIPASEIAESIQQINHQIESRDLRLVEYARILFVFKRTFGKRSSGVEAEIDHAKLMRNNVLVYLPAKKNKVSDTPFTSDANITVVDNLDDFYTKADEFMRRQVGGHM